MTNETHAVPDAPPGEVAELLEQRATLQGWIDKLDGQEGTVSDRVLRRVREDYESRLHRIVDALSHHRQAIQAELDAATARLEQAERAYSDAVDQLEEARLRHTIGEVDEDSWTDNSRALDQAVRDAEERQQEAREETGRLRELLSQIEERTAEAPAVSTSSGISFVDPGATSDRAVPEAVVPEPEDEDAIEFDPENEVFLEQVDRALAEQRAAANGAATEEEEEEEGEDTAPKPGLKCAECGYTNDLSAWFCGVCGADVG